MTKFYIALYKGDVYMSKSLLHLASHLNGTKAAKIASGIVILQGIASYLSKQVSNVNEFNQAITDPPKSVTEFNKKANIESRVYLDSLIVNESVIHPLLMSLQNLYAAYVMNTIQLNEYISDTHKVSDNLSIIATEDNHNDPELFNDLSSDFADFVGMEANTNTTSTNQTKTETKAAIADPPAPKNPLPEGRQISVTMTAENKESITVNLIIVLKPYYVKQELVKELIKLDTHSGLIKRYFQWRAGEISFMRDFIFQIDLIKQRSKTTRSDESGTLLDYINTQTLKGKKRFLDFLKNFDSKQAMSSNIANTILVFSEDAVKRAKADAGFDLHNEKDRSKYFERTYAMFICIIDPMYNKVYLYMNGYDNGATYSYSDFTSRSKDTADIKSIIETLTQNRMPSGGRF